MEQKIGLFIIIPSEMLLDREIHNSAKLLFGLIVCLTGKEGFCFATNKHLSSILDVKKDAIIKQLNLLKEKGWIKTEIIRGEKNNIEERRIFPVLNPKYKLTEGSMVDNTTGSMVDNTTHNYIYNYNNINNVNSPKKLGKFTAKTLFNLYNSLAEKTDLPKALKLTPQRKNKIKARLNQEPSYSFWRKLFIKIKKSKHLHKESWFNLDFIIRNDTNIYKIMEGWMDWKKENKESSITLPRKNTKAYKEINHPVYNKFKQQLKDFVKGYISENVNHNTEILSLQYAIYREVEDNWDSKAKQIIGGGGEAFEHYIPGAIERHSYMSKRDYRMFYPGKKIWEDFVAHLQKTNRINVITGESID